MKLTTHAQIVSKLRTCGVTSPFLHMPSVYAKGQLYFVKSEFFTALLMHCVDLTGYNTTVTGDLSHVFGRIMLPVFSGWAKKSYQSTRNHIPKQGFRTFILILLVLHIFM
jgi:hypothetical protein